jgi:hypothetical protein
MPHEHVDVHREVATDDKMKNMILKGTAVATSHR